MERCCPASPTQSDCAHSLKGLKNQAQPAIRTATQTRIPRSQDKSGRQSQTSCFLISQRVLKMKEGCTCLLDASQTLTFHKRGTSSCTPRAFACALGYTSFLSFPMHASFRDILPRRRTEVEKGQPRSPKNYPILHPFLSCSLKAELQLGT